MLNAPSVTGMPLVAPPDVPKERAAILRAAFMAMARDPRFVAEADSIGEPTESPIDGERLRALNADIIGSATDATVLAYKEMTGQP